MTPLRPEDLVRLRHTPEWTAQVMTCPAPELDGVMVAHPVAGGAVVAWVPVELLELVPEANPEVLRA